MKNLILGLAAAFAINTVAMPAYACTITPLGDTRLRIEALLNALNEMETLRVERRAVCVCVCLSCVHVDRSVGGQQRLAVDDGLAGTLSLSLSLSILCPCCLCWSVTER